MADYVKIVEVGPRDGLQNEAQLVSLDDKIKLVESLADAGLKHIECASFVSPKWVPQMANSAEVLKSVSRLENVLYTSLTPNMRGYVDAIESGSDEVAVFTAASEAFTQKNINCSIDESIDRFTPIIEKAHADKRPVRAYVSCILGCPYEGEIPKEKVIDVARRLLDMGCYEVSLGDTIGVGAPTKTKNLLQALKDEFSLNTLACHFHDTYGQAIANQFVALELGYRTFDTSVAGLGGCPYAKGASGNVSTEDTVYMLEQGGFTTGIDLQKLIEAGNTICHSLGRNNNSKVASALS